MLYITLFFPQSFWLCTFVVDLSVFYVVLKVLQLFGSHRSLPHMCYKKVFFGNSCWVEKIQGDERCRGLRVESENIAFDLLIASEKTNWINLGEFIRDSFWWLFYCSCCYFLFTFWSGWYSTFTFDCLHLCFFLRFKPGFKPW